MTDHAVSEDVKEKLCEYLKAALADEKNVSFKDAKEILELLSSENILGYLSGEVLSNAILWLDSLIDTEQKLISDNDYQSSFLLKDVAFDNDAERKAYIEDQLSELADLKLELVDKQSKLTEQEKHSVQQEKSAFEQEKAELKAKHLPDYKASKQTFIHILEYKSIADAIRKEKKLQVVKDMNRLAGKIYKNENNDYDMTPSFVVCCSSGTGKTQLPFCFKNEIHYFVLKISQDIYREYRHISKHLNKLIDIDFKNF